MDMIYTMPNYFCDERSKEVRCANACFKLVPVEGFEISVALGKWSDQSLALSRSELRVYKLKDGVTKFGTKDNTEDITHKCFDLGSVHTVVDGTCENLEWAFTWVRRQALKQGE